MTDNVKVSVSTPDWESTAVGAIAAGKTVYVSVSSRVMLEVISKIHEQAGKNPFTGLAKDIAGLPGVPPVFAPAIDKATQWMNAIGSVGSAPIGVLIALGMVMASAAAHNYQVELGWALHKLLDLNDDEAFVRLAPNAA